MFHQGNKWVIVFLIYADFRINNTFPMNEEMKIELNLLLQEILTTPLNPENARLFVIFNGIRFEVAAKEGLQNKSKTLFYEIVNPDNKQINKIGKFEIIDCNVSRPIQPNPNHPIQVADKLEPILQKIKIEEDEEVFLITWDHGSAFGIFREDTVIPPRVESRKPIYEELDNFPYLGAFWQKALENKSFKRFVDKKKKIFNPLIEVNRNLYAVSSTNKDLCQAMKLLSDETEINSFEVQEIVNEQPKLLFRKGNIKKNHASDKQEFAFEKKHEKEPIDLLLEKTVPEILGNDELAESLGNWIGQKKVGVLLMMNCWMMNLHTMYSLRKCVRCLVAPQGNISIPGYNYRDILRYVYKPESYYKTTSQLAIKCVKTSENKYAKKRAKKIYKNLKRDHDKIESWKIIAVDLQTKDIDGKNLFSKQMMCLKNFIDLLNLYIDHKPFTEMQWLLKYVRSTCFDFSESKAQMVDIINWGFSIIYANDKFSGHSKLPGNIEPAFIELKDLIFGTGSTKTLILKTSKGKSVYSSKSNSSNPIAVINLPPTGYSLFFPITSLSDDNLIDNIKKDLLLKNFLKNWKVFLNLAIDKTINW